MKFNKILSAFPTPKYLDLPFFGLSISDLAIHCIQIGRKNNKYFISKFTKKPIPPGVVTAGQINNKDELLDILQNLKKELKIENVRVSISEERAYLFTSKIPEVGEKEILSAVESKIEENIPVNPTELLFDYQSFSHKEKGHVDVVVFALPISTVNSYVEVLQNSGLTPLSLEIESQAIAKALLKAGDRETVLIANFQEEKIGLYVTKNRVVRFTSTISLKKNSPNYEGMLLQELKKLYVYWHTLKENTDEPDNKIDKMVICGQGVDEAINSYLSGHLEIKVVTGNVWANVFDLNAGIPDISFNDSLEYAPAIGLAVSEDAFV